MATISLLQAVARLTTVEQTLAGFTGKFTFLNGYVGLNEPNPQVALHVNTQASTGAAAHPYRVGFLLETEGTSVGSRLGLKTSNDGTEAPYLTSYRSRGTKAAPTAVKNQDLLFGILACGHDGSGYVSGPTSTSLEFRAGQDWSAAGHGSYMVLVQALNNSIQQSETWRWDQSGNYLGGTTSNPASELGASIPRAAFMNSYDVALRTIRSTKVTNTGVGGIAFAGLDANDAPKDIALIRGYTTEANSGSGGLEIQYRDFTTKTLKQAAHFTTSGNVTFYGAVNRSRVNALGGLSLFTGIPTTDVAHPDFGAWVLKNNTEFVGFSYQLNTNGGMTMYMGNGSSWDRAQTVDNNKNVTFFGDSINLGRTISVAALAVNSTANTFLRGLDITFQNSLGNQSWASIGAAGLLCTVNASFNNQLAVNKLIDQFTDKAAAGTSVAFDYATASSFYCTGVNSNFALALSNVPTTVNNVYNVTLMVPQGATAYFPSSMTLNGSPATIKWAGGMAPVPTPNNFDVFNFSLIRTSGGGWVVLGSHTPFV